MRRHDINFNASILTLLWWHVSDVAMINDEFTFRVVIDECNSRTIKKFETKTFSRDITKMQSNLFRNVRGHTSAAVAVKWNSFKCNAIIVINCREVNYSLIVDVSVESTDTKEKCWSIVLTRISVLSFRWQVTANYLWLISKLSPNKYTAQRARHEVCYAVERDRKRVRDREKKDSNQWRKLHPLHNRDSLEKRGRKKTVISTPHWLCCLSVCIARDSGTGIQLDHTK